jgi:hypothetical protein
MTRLRILTLSCLALTGCGQFGTNPHNASECTPEVYALDAMLPLGFTAQEAIDALLGERNAKVQWDWEDGQVESAIVKLQTSADTVEYVSDRGTRGCPTYGGAHIHFPGTWEINTTASTTLNETSAIRISVHSLDEATFVDTGGAETTLPAFEGTFEPLTCEECDYIDTSLSGTMTPDSSIGQIRVEGVLPAWWSQMVDTADLPEPERLPLATINWD